MSPTSMKLSDVFKDILIPRELDDLKIMGVNADSENRKIEVVLVSGRIIHYKIIEDFKSIVARKYNMASVIIRVKYENLSFRDVAGEMYYENLKFYVDSMCPGAGALLQGCTWINDGNSITIKCVNGVSMLYANKCNELIEKLVFAQLGDKVNVQFDDCIEVEDFLRQTEEIENSYDKIQVTYYEKIKYEKEDFLDESAVIYGKVIEEKPVPLKRLNPQSDYAVVHGEVFDMDTYETKGGKIILPDNEIPDITVAPTPEEKIKRERRKKIFRTVLYSVLALVLAGALVYFNFIHKEKTVTPEPPSGGVTDDVEYGNMPGDHCYGYDIPLLDENGTTGESFNPANNRG